MIQKIGGKWRNVVLASVMLTILGLPFHSISIASAAEYRYTYTDAASGTELEGMRQAISGSHRVWLALDDAGKSQVFYQLLGNPEVIPITTHDGLKESPVVSEDSAGNVRVAWEDQREGTTGTNWDIYAYDLGTGTEKKLNPAAGHYGHISMDDHYAVWVETSTSEMFLHDFQMNRTVAIGQGRFPIVSGGKVVYISPTDGGLFLYTIASGTAERILELPYHQYVDWFAFKDQMVVWKQRDLDLKSQYVMLNLDAGSRVPTSLTQPSLKAQEHSTIYIGDGTAAWLEYKGAAVQIVGADLLTGNVHQVTSGNRNLQLFGVQGSQILMADERNQLTYRTVIRTEIEIAPSAGPAPKGKVIGLAGGIIETDGAKLTIPDGAFAQNSRVNLEPLEVDSLSAHLPAASMRVLSKGWKVESEKSFQLPAVMSIPFDQSGIAVGQLQKVGLYRYDAENSSWTFAGGLADADAGQLNASIAGPGIYAAMINEPTFRDLQGHWSKSIVEVLAARWLVSGMNADTFAPNVSLTRAEFTKMLADAAGLDVQRTTNTTFKDVPATFWGHRWIEAAAQAGWIAGYDGKFNPNDPLTREQMMVMIVQAMGGEKEALALSDAEIHQILTQHDADQIAEWAKPYAAWVVKVGTMQGAGGKLLPKSKSNRAEGATVIYNWLTAKGEL